MNWRTLPETKALGGGGFRRPLAFNVRVRFVISALSLGASMIFNPDLILREIDWCASIDTNYHRDPPPLARSRRKASTGDLR
jgi:hypothetical protein